MSTLKDVAMRAGVSIGSASSVVNGTAAVSPAMRDRVERAVAELGYVPHQLARNLKTGRTSTIGLVLPDLTNPHFSGLAGAIEDACDDAGYTLTLCSTSDDAEKEVRQLRSLRAHRAAGVIVVPGGYPAPPPAALGPLLKGPVVVVDRAVPGLDRDLVMLDNHLAGRLAGQHLASIGHRRIAIVGGSPELAVSRDRVEGCREALRAAGVSNADVSEVDGGFQTEPTMQAALAALKLRPRPSAVVAVNNHSTVGVMKALARLRLKCPHDISVVCIDDFTWADAFSPRLTVVAQPIAAIGREAVRLLLEQCQGGRWSRTQTLVLKPTFIQRDSTRPPPAPRSSRAASPLAARPSGDKPSGAAPRRVLNGGGSPRAD